MRTDSRTYSKDFVNSAKSFISDKYGASFVRKDIDCLTIRQNDKPQKADGKGKTKSSKSSKAKDEKGGSAQEAHEAIRPTNIRITGLDLDTGRASPKERKMYSMIWRNTVESCMKPCLTIGIVANITAPNELSYRISEEEITEPGWKIVNGFDKENIKYRYLVSQKQYCPRVVEYSKIACKLGIKDTKGHYTEARLVQLLEERGIGRPSTFSSLIDKIQDRGYVKRGDVEGKAYKGTEFELVGEEITEAEVEKCFGGEKNKLVLQPLGAMVWEYLSTVCEPLFDYEYTKNMETELDLIEQGDRKWHTLCEECDVQVREYTDVTKKDGTNGTDIKIDDEHTYTVTKYGPVVVSVVDGKKVYKSAKRNIDIERIRNGTLSVEDIVDECKTNGKHIGFYEENEILLKTGKYGLFVQWGEKNVSVKSLGKNEKNITLEKVIPLLKESKEEKRFRELNKEMSVRVGKTPYVFYKTREMKKPKFLHLKGFDEDPFTCDENVLLAWLETTHKMKV
jgi:DNA topoisomerase-1